MSFLCFHSGFQFGASVTPSFNFGVAKLVKGLLIYLRGSFCQTLALATGLDGLSCHNKARG